MIIVSGSRQFWRKVKFFLTVFSNQPLGNGKSLVKGLHSLSCSKQSYPNRPIEKPIKEVLHPFGKENAFPENYTRNVVRNVSNILRYSTWDSAQEQLSMLSVKWDSYTVNQVLKTHPPLEKAWLFFNWASRLKGFKHDQFTYTTMLDIFGEARRISSMVFVFEQMQEKGIKIDVVTYTSLLHWLSNDGDIDGSMKLWDEMKAKGCRPTVVSYTAYMKILFNNNRVKDAVQVYKEMLQAGYSPNCYTYTVFMEHLACSGQFDDVLDIFSKMQEAGVLPDKATCNILVQKCCKAGETKTLNKILQYMKQHFLVLRYPVYLAALETLRVSGKSDLLLRQVNRHFSSEYTQAYRDEPSSVTIDTCSIIDGGLILIFLFRLNFVAVDSLLGSIMENSSELESGVLSAIIEVSCAHNRSKGALLAFEYSEKMGIAIDRAAYLSLIGLYIRIGLFPQVVNIFEKMVGNGIHIGKFTAALLLYRLGCAKRLTNITKMFELLPDDYKSKTVYTALMAAYFSAGDAVRGLKTFKNMRRHGISVTVGTYNLLITGLERCGRLYEAEGFKKEKRSLQAGNRTQDDVPMEEKVCNLIFSGKVAF